MKKFAIITLIIILSLSICACGRNGRKEPPVTTTPGTTMDILPDMDPTIGTNIPDPDVNSTMPMYTEGTGNANTTDEFMDMIPGNGK